MTRPGEVQVGRRDGWSLSTESGLEARYERSPSGLLLFLRPAAGLDLLLVAPLAPLGIPEQRRQQADGEAGECVKNADEGASPARDRQNRPGPVEQLAHLGRDLFGGEQLP